MKRKANATVLVLALGLALLAIPATDALAQSRTPVGGGGTKVGQKSWGCEDKTTGFSCVECCLEQGLMIEARCSALGFEEDYCADLAMEVIMTCRSVSGC